MGLVRQSSPMGWCSNWGIGTGRTNAGMPQAFFQRLRSFGALVAIVAGVSAAGAIDTSIGFVTSAHAQTVVRQIQVQGNRRVEPATVRSYLDFAVGDRYDDARVNSSLRALFATGLFADVNIYLQGTVVVVTVVENPVISKVAFEGNSEVETKTLVSEVRLKSRSVYTRARALARGLPGAERALSPTPCYPLAP